MWRASPPQVYLEQHRRSPNGKHHLRWCNGVHQFRSSTGSPYGLRGMTERGSGVQLVQQLWKIYGAATVLGSNEETHAQLKNNSCSSNTSIQSLFLITTTCHISYYLITHLPLSLLYDHF